MALSITLCDINPAMLSAWKTAFSGVPGVQVSHGDIFVEPAAALVSPANSFGFMDGVIDLVYTRRFGSGLSEHLQSHIATSHGGELPVGQAAIIPTGDAHFPWLISAPTMRVPQDVSRTVNAYLAFRAVLRAVAQFNAAGHGPIHRVRCPGLCTAVGGMPVGRAARQMRQANTVCVTGPARPPGTLAAAVSAHAALLR